MQVHSTLFLSLLHSMSVSHSRQHFNQAVSESILQIAEVVARGTEVFEDKENFLAWLDQPSTPLGERSPKNLLSSRFGAGMVLDELTRIEHGIVS